MRKKTAFIIGSILCSILALTIFFLYQWFYQPVTATISTDISPESKTRIEQMKTAGEISSSLRETHNEPGEFFTTTCFKTIVPLAFSTVRESEENNTCLVRAQLVKPRGLFVVHSEYRPTITSISEASGAMMRLQSSDYSQIDLQTNQPSTLVFKSDTELTVFVHQSPYLLTVAFSELGAVNDEVLQAAQNTVNSLEIFTIEQTE